MVLELSIAIHARIFVLLFLSFALILIACVLWSLTLPWVGILDASGCGIFGVSGVDCRAMAGGDGSAMVG